MRRHEAARPALETLEPRQLLSTITVLNTLDSGAGSLRQAILDANAAIGADIVEFNASLANSTITLTSGELQIMDLLEIRGLGRFQLTVSGNDASRVFYNTSTTTISDLSIAHGTGAGSVSSGKGGGIYNDSDAALNLTEVWMHDNTANDGGGIYNYGTGSTVALTDSTVSDNAAVSSGGGIYNSGGVVTLESSPVSGNTANEGGGIYSANNGGLTLVGNSVSSNQATGVGGGIVNDGALVMSEDSIIFSNAAGTAGGGIYNPNAGNSVSLTDSTISDNTAGTCGGGIYSELGGVLTVTDSTISLNTAGAAGGGIYNPRGGTVTLERSTVSGNTADHGGGLWNGGPDDSDPDVHLGPARMTLSNSTLSGNTANAAGGAIYNDQLQETGQSALFGWLEVWNSTIADNQTTSGAGGGLYINTTDFTALMSSIVADNAGGDVVGMLAGDSSDNLIKDASTAGGLTNGVDGNILGADPLLEPLAFNGGPTQTHALPAGSPAIDAGSNGLGLTTDQRGIGLITRGTSVDIGAFERHAPFALVVDTLSDEDDADYSAGNLSLREALTVAPNPGNDTITFHASLHGGTITLGGAELSITGDITVTGPGADLLSVSGNDASRVLSIASELAVVTLSGLRLTGGNGVGSEPLLIGGAISNAGSLTLANMTISGNSTGDGGGIYNSGTLTLVRSTVSGNSAEGNAGGIYNHGDGVLSITESTVSGNSSSGGGGIYASGTVTLTNSTVSGNTAATDNYGGGVFMHGGALTLTNSTIAYNLGGGGLAQIGVAALLTNTIVAGNVGGDVPVGTLAAGSTNSIVQDTATAGGLNSGANANLVGVDPLLGDLADNGGPTMTHALLAGSPAIDAGIAVTGITTDQRGESRTGGDGPDIGAYERAPAGAYSLQSLSGSPTQTTSLSDNTHLSVTRNADGDLIVFTGVGTEWTAVRLADVTTAPAVTGDPVTWTDPNDDLAYVAAPSAGGFLLFRRATDGTWTYRDLAAETGNTADAPVGTLTFFVTRPATGSALVYVAGRNAAGEIVAYAQSTAAGSTEATWTLHNISDDLTSRGMATPAFTELIAYVTPWNAWTIAGIDTNGDIQGIWVAPASFTTWRIDNLSDTTGAPPISGQLTVTQTSWSAINLGGVNSAGHLVVTWWIPSFGGDWVTSDLTNAAGGETMAPGRATGFVTPWGAMNYVGLNGAGEVTAYWWTPSTSRWTVTPLTARFGTDSSRPTGTMTSHVSDSGTMSVLGPTDTGEVTRLWWTPNDDGQWKLDNLSDIAVRA